jgi:hypothetical protein
VLAAHGHDCMVWHQLWSHTNLLSHTNLWSLSDPACVMAMVLSHLPIPSVLQEPAVLGLDPLDAGAAMLSWPSTLQVQLPEMQP